MDNVSPETIWFVSGFIVSAAIWLMRKFKSFDAAPAAIKQGTGLVFALLLNIVIPLMLGKELPNSGTLLVSVLTTFTSALSTYSVAKTVTGARKTEK